MAKQKFKLVYVKDGSLCGSYSGIPGKDDVVLIKRAVLEGLEAPEESKIPEGYILPEGVLEVIKNGTVDIAKYAEVSVNVPVPEGYVIPEGQVLITENGEVDIAGKASVLVQVDIPEGYLKPTGSLNITENGNYNVTEKASVDVNIPNPSSGTLEITENGDYDVSNYANANVAVEGSESFEANYLYPTDENGAILSDQGQEFDSSYIYYKDYDELHTYYPSAGSVYFFAGSAPTAMNLDSSMLYYYDGNTCNPLSQCFESSIEDGKFYIGDTNTSALIREPNYPGDNLAIMMLAAEDEDPQIGDYYRFDPDIGCYPLVKEYIYEDRLYWWSSSGTGFMYYGESMDADVPYLVSAGSNAILAERVGILDVGQEVTVELDGNTYKVTRTA